MVQPLWKTVWQFLKNLNIELPYDLTIPLLGIYPKELKIYVHAKMCKHTHIYGNIMQSSQKVETAQMPISRSMDK